MSIDLIVALLLAVAVIGYLAYSLLRPERF